jgi:hypothetical protein
MAGSTEGDCRETEQSRHKVCPERQEIDVGRTRGIDAWRTHKIDARGKSDGVTIPNLNLFFDSRAVSERFPCGVCCFAHF